MAAAIIVTAVPQGGSAKPNGKTWTSEIAAGAALLYYLGKLGLDNAKADRTGRAADAVIDWNPLPAELIQAAPAVPPSPAPASSGAAAPVSAGNPCLPASPMPSAPTNMRTARGRLVNDIGKLKDRQGCGGAFFADMRKRYENLRLCWNAFVYAQPAAAPQAPAAPNAKQASANATQASLTGAPIGRSGGRVGFARFAAFAESTLPPGGFTVPPATPAPRSSAPPSGDPGRNPATANPGGGAVNGGASQPAPAAPKTDACTGGFDVIDKAYAFRDFATTPQGAQIPALDERIDASDLAGAMSAPPLSQQILDLRVGSHIDDNALRAHLLYLSARALDDAILVRAAPFAVFGPKTGASTGSIDITKLSDSCLFNLNAKDCAAALATAEATAAADRRLDVSCDVARRSWLPPYTAILRKRKEANVAGTADFNADMKPWFGAVAGC